MYVLLNSENYVVWHSGISNLSQQQCLDICAQYFELSSEYKLMQITDTNLMRKIMKSPLASFDKDSKEWNIQEVTTVQEEPSMEEELFKAQTKVLELCRRVEALESKLKGD